MRKGILSGGILVAAIILGFGTTGPAMAQCPPADLPPTVMWINHLDFLPGDPSVQTSFNAINSGLGTGLSGLIIQSDTTGENGEGIGGIIGNKVVEKGVQVPPGYLVKGVRVCYQLSNARSFISQIRLAQVDGTANTASVILDDPTDLTAAGPICVDSQQLGTPLNPTPGGVRLDLRVNFGDITDKILLRAVGLYLVPDPDSALQQQICDLQAQITDVQTDLLQRIEELETALETHTHTYLTGKGVGHNNTVAVTGEAILTTPPPPSPDPLPASPGNGNGKGKKKKK